MPSNWFVPTCDVTNTEKRILTLVSKTCLPCVRGICYYHVHILKYVNPVNKPISLGMEPFNWLRAGLKTKKEQDIWS